MPLLRLLAVDKPAATAEEPDPASTQAAATAPPELHASVPAILLGYGLVAAGIAGGWTLYTWIDPKEFVPAPGTSAFALVFVLTAAIERLVEPLGYIAESAKVEAKEGAAAREGTKAEAISHRDKAIAAALETTSKADEDAYLKSAAEWHRLVERIRRNKAVVVWGMASMLAALASGSLGIFLLRVLGFDVHPSLDIAVTALAVGSGTKPLHELVKSLQTAKEDKKDPSEVTGKG